MSTLHERISRIARDELSGNRYASVEDAQLAMVAAIQNGLREDRFAVVRVPTIAHKGPHDTDASMLYTAAAKAESARYPVGGSNVGRAVAQVLRDVADAAETGA